MRRWIWAVLALFTSISVLAIAVLPFGGDHAGKTYAHVVTGTPGVNLPHAEIDMVQDAGGTWCNPVDPIGNIALDTDYTVAICLTGVPSAPVPPDAGGPPSALQFTLNWNPDLNTCIVPSFPITDDGTDVCDELDPKCLDSNPDANARHTGGTIFNGTGLGNGWTCSISDVKPACDNTAGTAFLQCNMTSGTGTLTLPVGPTVSWPIAVVYMHSKAGAGGVDTLSLTNTEIDDASLNKEVQCFGEPCQVGAVFGATDFKGVTPTPLPPTPTFTPTATFTPEPPTPTFTPMPPSADIDKIEDTGWCNQIDSESTEIVGQSHSLAVCAHNMPDNIAGFDLHISYDNGLDDCTEIDCTTGTCTDDNPALAAALGAGWDCTTSGQPVCDTDSESYIHCSGPGSITDGPLAILTLDVIAAGEDNVDIDSLVVYDDAGAPMGECGVSMNCTGATDTKVEATATPTQTYTPEPTATFTFTPTPTVWAFIDKNVANNCDPATRRSQSTEIVGQTHDLAVCLANVPTEIEGFSLTVEFNADLDQCVETVCPEDDTTCLDSNPDANAGETTFGTSLGPGWDCRIEGAPFCGSGPQLTAAADGDSIVGFATIYCERSQDLLNTFGFSFLDHVTLATVNLQVIAAGTDHVEIGNLNVWGSDVSIGRCGTVLADVNADTVIEQMPCIGATDIKQTNIRHRTPTPKPTATREPTVPPPPTSTPPPPPPTVTPTPLGGVGTQLVPPETGSGSGGSGLTWIACLLGGIAGASVLAGGFYLRFARRRAG